MQPIGNSPFVSLHYSLIPIELGPEQCQTLQTPENLTAIQNISLDNSVIQWRYRLSMEAKKNRSLLTLECGNRSDDDLPKIVVECVQNCTDGASMIISYDCPNKNECLKR